MKIAIYGICKNEAMFVKRFAESILNANKQPDGVYFTDTGSTDGTQDMLRSYGFTVFEEKIEPWRFDVARNVSLSHVPKDIDVLFCPDVDDILRPTWRETIEKNWVLGQSKNLNYPYINNYEADDVTPKITIWGFKVHDPNFFVWKYPIHEILWAPRNLTSEEAVYTVEHLLDHHPIVREDRKSRVAIFEEYMNTDEFRDDKRLTLLYASELFVNKEYARAIPAFLDYLRITLPYGIDNPDNFDGTIQARSQVCRHIGTSLMHCGMPLGEVVAWYVRAVGESPSQREPWMNLAKVWSAIGDGVQAFAAAKMGASIDSMTNSLELENEFWDERASALLEKTRHQMQEQLYYTNDIEGWMTDKELLYLLNAARRVDTIVEVGSWKGKSTHALLTGCADGVVHAVDHWKGTKTDGDAHQEAFEDSDGVYAQFCGNVGSFPNLKILRMSSEEASKQFEDKSIDMVFLDAGHTYEEVMQDIKLWLPKTKIVLCGHDYINIEGVQRAVDEAFGKENIKVHESIWSYRMKINPDDNPVLGE